MKKKEHLKEEDNKRKKVKHDNLDHNEKEVGDDEKNKLEKLIGKESWINFYKL